MDEVFSNRWTFSISRQAEMEIVEQDTLDNEDIADLGAFLLPVGGLSASFSQFCLAYNKKLLDGWVKQPSACCGAAAVAGAWNGLIGYHRREHMALSHLHVLAAYRDIFTELIDKKQAAFERKLGASIDPLLVMLKDELAYIGREIGGKKGFGATKLLVRKIVNKLCTRHYLSGKQQGDAGDSKESDRVEDGPVSALDCLVVLLQKEGFVFEEEARQADSTGSNKAESKGDEGKESDEVSAVGQFVTQHATTLHNDKTKSACSSRFCAGE
jgi:hypothetical protein